MTVCRVPVACFSFTDSHLNRTLSPSNPNSEIFYIWKRSIIEKKKRKLLSFELWGGGGGVVAGFWLPSKQMSGQMILKRSWFGHCKHLTTVINLNLINQCQIPTILQRNARKMLCTDMSLYFDFLFFSFSAADLNKRPVFWRHVFE